MLLSKDVLICFERGGDPLSSLSSAKKEEILVFWRILYPESGLNFIPSYLGRDMTPMKKQSTQKITRKFF